MNNFYSHQSCILDSNCKIGDGSKIWHFTHIMKDSFIGENCNIGQNVVISSDVIIGNNVKIQNNVSIYTGVEIKDDVFVGPSCVFTNVINPRSFINRKEEFRKTIIHKGASLGANSTIICGNEIGEFALVGAGAVVTKNVKAYSIVVGNPAKHIGWTCRCGIKLSSIDKINYKCLICNNKYILLKENLNRIEL